MLLEAARVDDGHCMYRLAHADAFSLAHVHARLAHADAFSLAHARLVYKLGGFRRADVTCSEIRQVQEG